MASKTLFLSVLLLLLPSGIFPIDTSNGQAQSRNLRNAVASQQNVKQSENSTKNVATPQHALELEASVQDIRSFPVEVKDFTVKDEDDGEDDEYDLGATTKRNDKSAKSNHKKRKPTVPQRQRKSNKSRFARTSSKKATPKPHLNAIAETHKEKDRELVLWPFEKKKVGVRSISWRY